MEDAFYDYIDQALSQMPEEFQNKLNNVSIFVEPHPSAEQARQFRLREENKILFGLYEGVPQSRRGRYGIGATVPDKITLFMYPILSRVRTREELIKQIKGTLYHEIGHHFGMSEKDIERAQDK